MNKLLHLAIHELITTVARPAFLLITLGLPLISALMFSSVAQLSGSQNESIIEALGIEQFSAGTETAPTPLGYVDKSGLIQMLPENITEDDLMGFTDEASAKDALLFAEIDAYYLIPEDYLASGKIIYVEDEANPFYTIRLNPLVRWMIEVNLLNGDALLAEQIRSPLRLSVTILEPTSERDQSNPWTMFLPYGVAAIFYIILFMSASLLLDSIAKETENRFLEIMITSVSPPQMMAGKIIGLGIAGLLQTCLWIGTGLTLLQFSGRAVSLPSEIEIPPSFLAWAIVFFLLGYLLYASIITGVGILFPNMREASQITTLIIVPLIIPVGLFLTFMRDPNGPLATGISLFPLTAPVAMMARLAASNNVPVWQIFLSASIILSTAALNVRLLANAFRAQTLLTGQAFNFKRALLILSGRI